MTKDKFIWRDPLDSEEAKQMEEGNVVFSCPEHGKETYFKIKALERRPSMQDYVYVWFKHRGHAEKMWVRITKGSRKYFINITPFIDQRRACQSLHHGTVTTPLEGCSLGIGATFMDPHKLLTNFMVFRVFQGVI